MTRASWVLLAIAGGAAVGSCKDVDCGDGTIERDGSCVPSNQTVGTANCGPGTILQGDQCLPVMQPAVCDDASTVAVLNDAGVTVCYGTGGGNACGTPIACDAPTDGTQTICGQIYDFETNDKFAADSPTGAQCTGTETMGPCGLALQAYDAYVFGQDPQGTPPLTTGAIYLDDCGRFRIPNIAQPTGPFVGLGIDDRNPADLGPTGITNAVGLATGKAANTATPNFEAFIVKPSTTTAWATTGAPTIAEGYFAPVFRAHSTGTDNLAGVKVLRNGVEIPDDDYYFQAADTVRTTIDPTAVSTGANGTALVDHAMVTEQLAYSGDVSALANMCRWETHAGATLPGIVFIQIFRPINSIGGTCPL